MSIKSAIDKLTGKSSKNIEDAISKIDLGGGKPAPTVTTLFDQTMTFSAQEEMDLNLAYIAPFDPSGWADYVNDDITVTIDNQTYTNCTIDNGEYAGQPATQLEILDDNQTLVANCVIGTGVLPDVEGITFVVALMNEDEGDHRIVIKATEKAQPDVFVVTLTVSREYILSDKTFDEILEAFEAGKAIYAYISGQGRYIPLTEYYDDELEGAFYFSTFVCYSTTSNPQLDTFSVGRNNYGSRRGVDIQIAQNNTPTQ